MAKRCLMFPHCGCGITLAGELFHLETKLIIYLDRDGSLKRVPTSEVLSFAIVEGVEPDQYAKDCPKHEDHIAHRKEMEELAHGPMEEKE